MSSATTWGAPTEKDSEKERKRKRKLTDVLDNVPSHPSPLPFPCPPGAGLKPILAPVSVTPRGKRCIGNGNPLWVVCCTSSLGKERVNRLPAGLQQGISERRGRRIQALGRSLSRDPACFDRWRPVPRAPCRVEEWVASGGSGNGEQGLSCWEASSASPHFSVRGPWGRIVGCSQCNPPLVGRSRGRSCYRKRADKRTMAAPCQPLRN